MFLVDWFKALLEKEGKSSTSSYNIDFSQNYTLLNEILGNYLEVRNSLHSLYREIEKIQQSYIVDIILDQLVTDTLAPEVSSQKILEISLSVNDKKKLSILEQLKEAINFDLLIQDIASDLISYGDYTLRPIVEPGEGIIEIKDDVLPGQVFPLYRNQEVIGYVTLDEKEGRVEITPPSSYIKFFIDSRRIRLRLPSFVKEKYKDLPEFVKIGTPLFTPGVIKKIKELDLLEKLIPASKIQQLSKGNVVGVYVPPSYSPQEAYEFAKKLERKLNALGVGIDKSIDQLTVTDLLKGAGRVKVLPVTSEKGQVTKLDYKSEEPSDLLQSIKDLRETILTSIGIPPELIFSSDSSDKVEILKRYARYFRKIKAIQKAIVNGVKDIILLHFINKGEALTPDEIQVRFANTPINVDDLDRIEYQQATIQILSDILGFFDNLSQNDNYSSYVNKEAIARYLNDTLTKIGLDATIQLPSEPPEEDYLED